jgi:hypothetical protein
MPPAVAEFMRGDGLHHRATQPAIDAVQRGLRFGVATHRQHQLAAAVHNGHAQGRLARRGLRLHDDVQRQGLGTGKLQHGQGRFEPGPLGGREIDGRGNPTRQQQAETDPAPPSMEHAATCCLPGPLTCRGGGPQTRA